MKPQVNLQLLDIFLSSVQVVIGVDTEESRDDAYSI
jgi:hypothetical protein